MNNSTAATWFIIANPVSGGGKSNHQASELAQLLQKKGIAFELFFTEKARHSIAYVHKALEQGFRHFAIMGGDGSFFELTTAILAQQQVPSTEITVLLAPAGTGNDFARTAHLPQEPLLWANMIEAGKTRLIDTVSATFQNYEQPAAPFYFLNVAGLGFDAYVAKNYLSKNKNMGQLSYLLSVLQGLFSYRNQPVAVAIDPPEGSRIATKIFTLAVGNGKYFGGGMKICPHAEIDDGLLYVTLIQNMLKLDVVRQLSALYNGTFIKHPRVSTYEAKRILISSPKPVYVQLDGEVVGQTPVKFEIIPQSLRILVP